jgi:hypothetical protein
MPGSRPAISRRPTSISAIEASSTPSDDGGMIIASPPVPRIGPIDMRQL